MIFNMIMGGRESIIGTLVTKTVAAGATITAGDFITFDSANNAAPYSGTIDGVARSSGIAGETILVYTPTAS